MVHENVFINKGAIRNSNHRLSCRLGGILCQQHRNALPNLLVKAVRFPRTTLTAGSVLQINCPIGWCSLVGGSRQKKASKSPSLHSVLPCEISLRLTPDEFSRVEFGVVKWQAM